MEEEYVVLLGNQETGKVRVYRQGLYYRFVCRCKISGGGVFRLHVICGERRENLGVVVPVGDGFGLDTKLPVKQLGEGSMEFLLLPKHETAAAQLFVPICPEEPFGYIARLKDAYLVRRNGQTGVLIT